ncbi:sigma-70 family RNA polymerase sigma factor [Arthrobacter sp. JZ12]|uniref:RNA polymerase sigma factor n=1 Tax=Arthrobacter sp. JZ12 TaxID=2654190 RepID=UPI002B4A83C8|nr:RNA polymerase sigma factor [Arthrobacter sp. JZ12]WRH25823.1 sigma-70 family RNA polymerase sigma factor [Arthrobacter sp. JZ12]
MGESDSDEAALWASSLAGDGNAFGALFDRHRERVHRHVCYFLGSARDAEDVAATAFLELWRRRQDVRLVEGSVLPWLLVTATNAARNSRRATIRYRGLLDELPRSRNSAPDAEEDYLEQSPLDAVHQDLVLALRSLKAKDAELFALVVIQGYPISMAAHMVGLTEGAAKTRIRRARIRLRSCLEGHPELARVEAAEGARS